MLAFWRQAEQRAIAEVIREVPTPSGRAGEIILRVGIAEIRGA